jgi:hypothetical protein
MTLPRARVRLVGDGGSERVSPAGPLRSTQAAELEPGAGPVGELWSRAALERMATAYWRFLERRSLGLLRIADVDGAPAVTLISTRLPLLRFRPPRYDSGPGFGRVTWPIERGALVARDGRGRGYLRFDVRRLEGGEAGERALVTAEVANFYPWLRGSGRFARIGTRIYAQTQARLHVWTTRGFLHSLDRLEAPGATD